MTVVDVVFVSIFNGWNCVRLKTLVYGVLDGSLVVTTDWMVEILISLLGETCCVNRSLSNSG